MSQVKSSAGERLLPPSIDPQLLDETAATVAAALGVLDDLPEELANTVFNCYYRFMKFAKTRNPKLQGRDGTKTKSALESFKHYSTMRTRRTESVGHLNANSRSRTKSKSYTGLLDR
jgi:hypothetical protein